MRSVFRIIISFFLVTLFALSVAYGHEETGQALKKLEPDSRKDVMWIGGKIIWPGHDLSNTSVDVFKDPELKDMYTGGLLLKPEGIYNLTIDDPGTYYIAAFVDDNDNGRFDAGDGIGIYGVTDWADPDQKSKAIRLEEGMKIPDIDIQITAVVDYQGHTKPLSLAGSGPVSGVSGKLIRLSQKGEFSNAIVFVYSDPSWNNRIAQANVSETGEYHIALPAGRYYLLAVIDQNSTNLLDVGDEFGIWGMTRFGMFPKAVEVSEGQLIKDRNILIIGQMGVSGKPLPLQKDASIQSEEGVASEAGITLSGNVIWPGHKLRSGMVQAYSDPSMTMAIAQVKTDDMGRFQLVVPAGDYYVIAGVDSDGDGKYTSGDGIGAYGAGNAAEQMPEKLTITHDSQNTEINLLITAQFDNSGQLKPIPEQVQQASTDTSAEIPTSSTGISGKIKWEGRKISRATLIFSDEPRFHSGISAPLELGDDGSYKCSTPPGDYYIMAIVDQNENDLMGTGAGRGFYGAGYRGAPQKVTVLEGRMTPFINISVSESFGPDGKLSPVQTPSSIRFWYGEPDNVYKDSTPDRVTQEWWYWSRGVAFTFEETDFGWNLTDTHEFTPVDTQPESAPPGIEKTSDGIIYYTFDRVIWTMGADGSNRRWIASGTRPTADIDGEKLLFFDTNGNIHLIQPRTEAPAQLVLGRREAGLQPAISHNGKAIAFTQEKRAILKNLETGEEDAIPSGAMDMYDPAWSSDDNLIAYSASSLSSPDPRERNRDIYYYDLTSGRTERISMSPMDEFEPAWSPVGKRVLIYCRAEDGHSQLWIVSFDADGKPIERQLTKHGGRNPAWSPGGDRIVYENNAQLWTINPDGSDEKAVTVDGEPIFGLDPFWTR